MSHTIQKRFSIVSILVILALLVSMVPIFTTTTQNTAAAGTDINKTMMQAFEWYVPNDGLHWNRLADRSTELANIGLSAMWVPPTYKGAMVGDTGYGVYDMWDMGEFDIGIGTGIRTKYGDVTQLRSMISTLHGNGIAVYEDAVFNHRFSVEAPEVVSGVQKCTMYTFNRDATCGYYGDATMYTVLKFPQRAGKYDSYQWDKGSFNSADWDAKTKTSALFKWAPFNWEVDTENGNYDFLMASNVDFNKTYVVDQLVKWSNWAMDEWGFDGFRYDAVKHIKFDAITSPDKKSGILDRVRLAKPGKNIFAVGEYWNRDLNSLTNYLNKAGWGMSLFDVPLHYKFFGVGKGGFDMRNLNQGNLHGVNYGMNAVTFVENHDTQYGQALLSPVEDWAKGLGYAYILTHQQGLPMIFYADYYGYEYRPAGYSAGTLGSKEGVKGNLKWTIDKLMAVRTKAAYGKQNDYFDDGDVVGFSREGVSDMPNSGSATVLCDGWACSNGGGKWMFMGTANGGKTFKNVLGTKVVSVPSNGWAFFPAEGNAAVYMNTALFNADGSVSSIKAPLYVDPAAPAPAVATPAPTMAPTPAPTPTPAPVVVATPAPANPITNQTVTIYYKKTGFTNANVHYSNTKDKVWTVAPGAKMAVDATTGYFKLDVTIPDGSQLTACFNNGSTWDSNGGKNYTLNGNSTVSINNGVLTAGAPAALATTATAAPATTTTTTTLATPVPTIAPAPTAAPIVNATTVSVSFSLGNVSTAWGDSVAITGDFNGWVTSGANVNKLQITGASVGSSNTWTGKVTVGVNKTINYKFVKISSTGAVTWENGYSGNRTLTVGTSNPALVSTSWNVK